MLSEFSGFVGELKTLPMTGDTMGLKLQLRRLKAAKLLVAVMQARTFAMLLVYHPYMVRHVRNCGLKALSTRAVGMSSAFSSNTPGADVS